MKGEKKYYRLQRCEGEKVLPYLLMVEALELNELKVSSHPNNSMILLAEVGVALINLHVDGEKAD